MIDDRLSSFDHHFKLQAALRETVLAFQAYQQIGQSRNLFRDCYLRQGDDEIIRKPSFCLLRKSRDEDVERPKTSRSEFLVERFYTYSDERRQRSIYLTLGHLCGGGFRMTVFLNVRSVAVAVF